MSAVGGSPPRLNAIRAAVASLEASVVGLVDTFRWAEIYTDADLRRLFQYPCAFHFDMNCEVVDPRVGLTVVGNHSLMHCEPVRIYDRDCLRAYLQVEGVEICLYVTYLTSFSGVRRSKQVAALLEHANTHAEVPTLIMGDLNSVRPERLVLPARWLADARQRWPRFTLHTLGPLTELYELVDTSAIAALRAGGFKDELANNLTETFHRRMLGMEFRVAVDYCLSRNIAVESCEVLRGRLYEAATDHYAVKAVV